MTKRLQAAWAAPLLAVACATSALPAEPRLLPDFVVTQRVERGDLLLLPGVGLQRDARVQVSTPGRSATVVARGDSPWPHGILVELPDFVDYREALELRLATATTAAPLRFNVPRPAWLSPASVSADSSGHAPRELWVMGAALALGTAGPALHLSGPRSLSLGEPVVSRDEYLVYRLPPALEPGQYRVAVVDDSGRMQVGAALQLTVDASRAAPAVFDPREARFGGCAPDDAGDDGGCLRRALRAARAVARAEVRLAPGRWRLRLDARDGPLEVSEGVALVGVPGRTTVELDWQPDNRANAAFVLLGGNAVSGLRFVDLEPPSLSTTPRTVLRLGPAWQAVAADAPPVRDLVIVDNEFAGVYRAIADGGLALERLRIEANRFEAFETALQLGGDRFRTNGRFRIVDGVIADNLFEPGALFDPATARGPIASEVGGSLRLRFSGNVTAAPQRGTQRTAPGWRAAFFWHLQDSHEDLLIARNVAQCPGSLVGDGEGIALDNNGATSAYGGMAEIVGVGQADLSLGGAMRRRQNDRDLPPVNPYAGHWLQVVAGDGLGQLRRVRAHAAAAAPGTERFELEGDPMHVPGQGARAIVGRAFLRPRILDNHVDQRASVCGRRNRSGPRGGAISLWANTIDAVVARNVVEEGEGVIVNHSWSGGGECRGCGPTLLLQWRPRISMNAVLGENDRLSNCSLSGIELRHGASAAATDTPPLLGFGALVSRNSVVDADGLFSGAIALPLTWHAGPAGHQQPLVDGYVVQRNAIGALPAEPARGSCGAMRARAQVFIAPGHTAASGTWRDNSCAGRDGVAPCVVP